MYLRRSKTSEGRSRSLAAGPMFSFSGFHAVSLPSRGDSFSSLTLSQTPGAWTGDGWAAWGVGAAQRGGKVGGTKPPDDCFGEIGSCFMGTEDSVFIQLSPV